ncbi:MAG: large-conductance mechanosensitive channel protein MscL [Phycisphaerae bacterium]|nr:large-conductance mechanosensitive channel protein MscL [Phycisphaerae bacterium]
MSLLKEFQEFAVKGNAVDMAVGIIIGAAFGKIVTSLVNDVIMPPIGLLLGGTDFNKLQIVLKHATLDPATAKVMAPEVTLRYGAFINTVLDFLIVAFCLFMVIKLMNAARQTVSKPNAPK